MRGDLEWVSWMTAKDGGRRECACLAISRESNDDEDEIYFPKKDIKNDNCDVVFCIAYREGAPRNTRNI